MREFLHVDDLANAVVFATEKTLPESLYNVGSGRHTIAELANLVSHVVGFEGNCFGMFQNQIAHTKTDGCQQI